MKKLLLILFMVPLIFISCNKQEGFPLPTKQFIVTIENVSKPKLYLGSGVINTPKGDAMPGPITPGKKYEFMVKAGKGQKLSFAVMLAATNDLFFAPDEEGIALYDNTGKPIASQNVTNQVYLWDAGTEINEEPAVGPNTVTNQPGPNTGPAENGPVQLISKVTTDKFQYPAVNKVIKVRIKYMSGYYFMVTIEDVSAMDALKTSKGDFAAPVSPGVWVVHIGKYPLFKPGEPDWGKGLEAIAEDGNPTMLGEFVKNNTGLPYVLSPGAWAVHKEQAMPIFSWGKFDYGEGLEGIAEDGNAAMLGESLKKKYGVDYSGVFNTPDGAAGPVPIGPGMKYSFTFPADKLDVLSFATMFVQSNDLFYSPGDRGIHLFGKNGAINGDVTSQLYLLDAGTEKNEEPGYGPNQAMRQSAPNTGVTEHNAVDKVHDEYSYPATEKIIRVTVSSH